MPMTLEDVDDIHLFIDTGAFGVPGEYTFPLNIAKVSQNTTSIDSGSKASSTNDGKQDELAMHKARVAQQRQALRQHTKIERNALMRRQRELTEELLQLKRNKEIEHARLVSHRTPSFYHWKAIATRELEERLQVEAEYKHLTGLVKTQDNYIKAIGGEIRKRSGDSAVSKSEDASVRDKKKPRINPTEVELYNAYIQGLKANHAQIDALFEECDMASLISTDGMVHSVRRRESDGKIEFFQQLNKYMEPFTLRETAATLWDMSKTQLSGRGLHERCIDVEDPKNIFVTKFRETTTSKTGTEVSLLYRSVGRRFLEAERIVHVWRTIIEGEGKFSGKCLEETGWVRLRPSPEMAEPGTLIEMCIRKFPRHLKSSKSDDGVGQFHEAVQGIGDTTEAEIISLMENVLIEDTLAGILS